MTRDDEIFYDISLSMVKYCNERVASLQLEFPDLVFLDWDAHSEIPELPPSKDLLGPTGIGVTREEKLYHVVLGVGVSTINDPSLFRIRKLVSKVFGDFQPLKKLPIYRAETADGNDAPVGWVVMQPPVTVSPMSRAETRILQFVQMHGLLDPMTPQRV